MLERDPAELVAENAHVLTLVQAMLGTISPNMRAVSVELTERGVRLHFLLAEEDEGDGEAIEDIVFEFEALMVQGAEVDVSVVVSSEPMATGTIPGRRIIGRREG